MLPFVASTGVAQAADSTVTVDIGAGRNADKVGTATITVSSTTLTVNSTLDEGVTLDESHLCVDDAPFTSRIAPGSCQFQNDTGDYSVALADVEPALTGSQVCVQLHYSVTTSGEGGGGGQTAYAGHQPSDNAFYGNVCLEIPGEQTTPPSGSFTTECTATGAAADVGTLSEGTATGGSYKLVSGDFSVVVTSGQQNVTVPPSSTINLVYVPATGDNVVLDTETSPAACTTPPVVTEPTGSFTTECIAAGAQADIGTLSAGTFTGGSFLLVSGTFSATVTSGQQDVSVPGSSTINLVYRPAAGADKVLDTESSPAACPAVGTPGNPGGGTPGTPAVDDETDVEGTKNDRGDDDTAVEGTKSETEGGVLAATGSGDALTLVAVAMALLLLGAGLVAAPRLATSRGQRRKA